jgi:hypothetical protein
MIGRSSKFFFAFYDICMKSQKACQLIVVWNLTFYAKDSLLEWLKEVPSFSLHFMILMWTPCIMHRCVISTMFGWCFWFFF